MAVPARTPVTDFLGTYVAVDFVGASGWAMAVYGTLYRTLDAGVRTRPNLSFRVPSPRSPDIDFWDAQTGYVVGGSGYAARSGDGGTTWQTLPTPNTTDTITDIVLIGPDELWISTADGKAMYSVTGGQNWAVMDAGNNGFGSL